MNLEKRVQNLEQELQILKNQIQATLLNIQEQLLTNAYPSLRANDVSPDSDEVHPPHSPVSAPKPEPPHNTEADQVSTTNVRQVSLNSPKGHSTTAASSVAAYDGERPDEDAPPSVVRKVSLDELDPMPSHRQQVFATSMPQQPRRPVDGNHKNARQSHRDAFTELPDDFNTDEFVYDGTSAAPFVVETDWETLAHLEEWAASKIDAIGVVRTRKLIQMYGHQGRFTNQIMSALLQFVSIYEDDNNTALPTPENHDELPDFLSETDESEVYDEDVVSADYQEDDANMEENPEENRRTVLRLIAGIQNAGAGIRGKRRNG